LELFFARLTQVTLTFNPVILKLIGFLCITGMNEWFKEGRLLNLLSNMVLAQLTYVTLSFDPVTPNQ